MMISKLLQLLLISGAATQLLPLTGAELRPLVTEPEKLRTSFFMAEKGQNSEPGEIDGKKMLWIEYNRAEGPWCAMAFQVPGRSLTVGPFRKAVFQVELFIPEEAGAKWINLQLIDRDDEIFQISALIAPDDRNWKTYTVEADTAKSILSWGGKVNNKVIDFPARLHGLTIDFYNKLGTGRVGLGKISIIEEE